MRKAVTTDLMVLQKWPKSSRPGVGTTSQRVAGALRLTVFQITARLKAMEGRGFLRRDEAGFWHRAPSGVAEAKHPSATIRTAKTPRIRGEGLPAIGLPDDRKVKHIRATKYKDGWRMHYVGVEPVFVAPDEREYAKARTYEAADLLVDWPKDGWDYRALGVIRLRLLVTSKAQRDANRAKREAADYRRARLEKARSREEQIAISRQLAGEKLGAPKIKRPIVVKSRASIRKKLRRKPRATAR
ncbi:MAG TPA: hypothetical protein VJZ25_07160 [Gemmatimonadaceae bacterium]|nr:hypothetical protein [Gemmatimonadaceae bacterium]